MTMVMKLLDGGSYTMDAFLWYGCHQNDSYSVCSTLGSAEHYRSGHETYSFVDGKTTFADEIRVAVNPENLKRGDYQQLVICEIDFFGRSWSIFILSLNGDNSYQLEKIR